MTTPSLVERLRSRARCSNDEGSKFDMKVADALEAAQVIAQRAEYRANQAESERDRNAERISDLERQLAEEENRSERANILLDDERRRYHAQLSSTKTAEAKLAEAQSEMRERCANVCEGEYEEATKAGVATAAVVSDVLALRISALPLKTINKRPDHHDTDCALWRDPSQGKSCDCGYAERKLARLKTTVVSDQYMKELENDIRGLWKEYQRLLPKSENCMGLKVKAFFPWQVSDFLLREMTK